MRHGYWLYCRLILAIFDTTISVVCICKLVGKLFKEKLGVREGAMESPHQLNAYFDAIHNRLTQEHPRQCKIFGIIIVVRVHADVAAMPADSDDLVLSARILEQFCNDNHLFISAPKSHITIFHHRWRRRGFVFGQRGLRGRGARASGNLRTGW